ncbi:outer membrane lipoprotein carrier protein LolA [bacterium]|nr:outer membrane lipoprotein carrier protein LolA [candidate division CSSED10-310 bacterium]
MMMLIRRISTILLLIVILILSAGTAMTDEPCNTNELQKYLDKIRAYDSFRMSFTQELQNSTSGQIVHNSGSVVFKKPNEFRWDYQTPPKNILASDGNIVIMVLPEDKQAMMEPMDNNSTIWSPLAIFTDFYDWHTEYTVDVIPPREEAYCHFKLMPKTENGRFRQVEISFNRFREMPAFSMSIFDAAGNRNYLEFENFESQPSTGMFIPEIPPDYQITDFSGQPLQRTLTNTQKAGE